MTKSNIKITPCPYTEVLALLQSEALRAVEEPIAAQQGLPILRDYSVASTSHTQAEMSVSGMSPADMEKFLVENRDQLIRFWLCYVGSQRTTRPAGKVLGLGAGFGVKIAILYNFVANRSVKEFHEFLKNRRIGGRTKYTRELKQAFESSLQ